VKGNLKYRKRDMLPMNLNLYPLSGDGEQAKPH